MDADVEDEEDKMVDGGAYQSLLKRNILHRNANNLAHASGPPLFCIIEKWEPSSPNYQIIQTTQQLCSNKTQKLDTISKTHTKI